MRCGQKRGLWVPGTGEIENEEGEVVSGAQFERAAGRNTRNWKKAVFVEDVAGGCTMSVCRYLESLPAEGPPTDSIAGFDGESLPIATSSSLPQGRADPSYSPTSQASTDDFLFSPSQQAFIARAQGQEGGLIVRCGQMLGLWQPGSSTIENEEGAVESGSQFERTAGRGAYRNWKKSVSVINPESGRCVASISMHLRQQPA